MRLFRRTGPDGKATGPWMVWFYDAEGKRVQKSTKLYDYHAAERLAREFEREAADPALTRTRKATLGDALDLLLTTRDHQAQVGARSSATVAMYVEKCAPLRRLLGADTKLTDLTAARIDTYLTARRAEKVGRAQTRCISPHTISKELVTLRAALKLARRQGLYQGDPAAIFPIGYSPAYRPRARALGAAELPKLLCELPPDKSARIAFIVATGARWGESCRARREDINPGLTSVRLRGTKTALSARTIPVVSATRALLEYALTHAQGTDGALFQPWPNNSRRDILAACDRAGIPGCTANDLRRTLATVLRAAGAPVELLAPILGHRDTRMVEMVYGRLSADSLGLRLENSLGTATAEREPDCSKSSTTAPTNGADSGKSASDCNTVPLENNSSLNSLDDRASDISDGTSHFESAGRPFESGRARIRPRSTSLPSPFANAPYSPKKPRGKR
jgi:integrase